MVWNVFLPPFNGSFEAGVAVGIDPALAESSKLHIHSGDQRHSEDEGEVNAVIGLTLRWVWSHFIEGKGLSDDAIMVYMYFTYAALKCGLISLEDGDVVASDLTTHYSEANGADAYWGERIIDANITSALTIAVATKASFWLTNHHLGGSEVKLGSYIAKVVKLKLGHAATSRQDVITAVHTVGHWTSTKIVLHRAKVPHILVVDPAVTPQNDLILSKDAQLRFSGLPAGTHRLAVAYEAARCIARSRVLIICPSPADFIPLSGYRETIMANPARYHIGSLYLTGEDRLNYDDASWSRHQYKLCKYVH